MSGHSHFKTVAATKNANDAKRGKIFSKLGRVITIIAKEKGGDIITNAALKTASEKAKGFNMPKENIERAIKKGTGELAGEALEEVSFEALGPGGAAIIMSGITDNKNRTLGEIKGIVGQHGGKLAGEGAVRWMFAKKGFMAADSQGKSKEELELLAIESGAQDVVWNNNKLQIYTAPEDFETVKKAFEQKGIVLESASLDWVANEEITVNDKDKTKLQALFEALDENDAVQEIYSNLKL